MKVYYIFDSYCGWCYGFETILKPFIEAHPELEVTVRCYQVDYLWTDIRFRHFRI